MSTWSESPQSELESGLARYGQDEPHAVPDGGEARLSMLHQLAARVA